LDSAVTETEPVAPDHLVDLTLGVVISIIGGMALVLLRHILTGILSEHSAEPASTS